MLHYFPCTTANMEAFYVKFYRHIRRCLLITYSTLLLLLCFSADSLHLLCCVTPCESSGRFFWATRYTSIDAYLIAELLPNSSRSDLKRRSLRLPHAVHFTLPLLYVAALQRFLPRDALQCKAQSCDCMSSVCLSVVCDVGE